MRPNQAFGRSTPVNEAKVQPRFEQGFGDSGTIAHPPALAGSLATEPKLKARVLLPPLTTSNAGIGGAVALRTNNSERDPCPEDIISKLSLHVW